MNIRAAKKTDGIEIQATAEQSFQTSYSLSPEQIRTIVETEFSEDSIDEKIENSDRHILVSVRNETEIAGFVDIETNGETTLHWLHVDPDVRGEGIGSSLVEEVQNTFGDKARFTANILREAREGGEFLERFDLYETDSDETDIGGVTFHYQIYTPKRTTHGVSEAESEDPREPTVDVPEYITVDGDELIVNRDELIPGTEAPFFPIYLDESYEERYGFFCSECGSTDISAGSLDRLECGNCGNLHRPDEYDDAYL